VFLFAIPIGISIVEIELGIQRFPSKPLLAGPLLVVSTLLVLWAALTLAVKGAGTPLPIDPPREFVVTGPYAYLRHPFVAGLTAQIVALGIALGSVPVIAYAAVAMAVWYYGVRPREERRLDERFGSQVQEYRRRVRGFRPF
jgi:protein-S-isoprenylcysteine O-methyltransferase Ste14